MKRALFIDRDGTIIIEPEDEHRGDDAHIPHGAPRPLSRQSSVGSHGIGACMTSNDKLAHHAWHTEEQDATNVKKDEGGTAVLTGHIRETPDVA